MDKRGKSKAKGDAKDGELTPRRERFADNYVANGGNGKKAAEDAGFAKGQSAEVEASRLLRNAKVRERINARCAEARIPTNEILGTLAGHMRADVADFMPDNEIVKAAQVRGVSHLIKKLKVRERLIPSLGGEPIKEVVTELELHDSQSAARYLAKVRGLEQAPRENDQDVQRKREALLVLVDRLYEEALGGGQEVTREQIIEGIVSRRPDAAQYLNDWVM